jgi:hypothetical protein
MTSVAGRCPPCGVHPSGVVVRGSAVQPSGVRPSGVQPSGVQPSGVQHVQCPARPVSSRLVSTRPAGCCPPPSVRTRPSPPTPGGGVGDQVGAVGNLYHRNGSRSWWAAASWSGSIDGRAGPDAGDAAGVARWSVGGGGGPGPGGCGRRPRVPAEGPGRPGRRAERRRWRLRCGHRSGLPREVAAPAAWLPSWAGWATTVGGGREGCRPGGRARTGQWACRWGWACGPSAAQAGSGRFRLAAGSAVTCGNSWWACQDLNLGPHPDPKIHDEQAGGSTRRSAAEPGPSSWCAPTHAAGSRVTL